MFLALPFILEFSLLDANGADPDQTPRSAASDLGLHCLQMSLLWDTWYKWAKIMFSSYILRYSMILLAELEGEDQTARLIRPRLPTGAS